MIRPKDHEESYFNKKHYHSLNVLIVSIYVNNLISKEINRLMNHTMMSGFTIAMLKSVITLILKMYSEHRLVSAGF